MRFVRFLKAKNAQTQNFSLSLEIMPKIHVENFVENFVDCGKPCGKPDMQPKPEKHSFCNFFDHFAFLYPNSVFFSKST